ncbi:unnamed protein product [Symbiodinium microadriaticum]|nr:unnamed protein product [Symbiodinium microadriaticum]
MHLPALLLQNADGSDRVLRNFEFLGAAIGDDVFVHAHTTQRAGKTEELLDAIAELADVQVKASSAAVEALQALQAALPADHNLTIDKAALWSEAGLGARAFLNAVPSGPTRMEPAVFAAELRTRDLFFSWADRAGLRPEKETLAKAARGTGAAAAAYARHKETHLNTARTCENQGVVFVPMVVEATGAWDKGAAIVIKHVARAAAARMGLDPVQTHACFLQELCVVVRSWRARAALRRRCETATLAESGLPRGIWVWRVWDRMGTYRCWSFSCWSAAALGPCLVSRCFDEGGGAEPCFASL